MEYYFTGLRPPFAIDKACSVEYKEAHYWIEAGAVQTQVSDGEMKCEASRGAMSNKTIYGNRLYKSLAR